MFRDVDTIALGVFDPALRNGAEGVFLSFGLGDFFDSFDTLYLEAKMVNAPGVFVGADEG